MNAKVLEFKIKGKGASQQEPSTPVNCVADSRSTSRAINPLIYFKGNDKVNIAQQMKLYKDGSEVIINEDGSYIKLRPLDCFEFQIAQEEASAKWRRENGADLGSDLPNSVQAQIGRNTMATTVLIGWGGPQFEGTPDRLEDGSFNAEAAIELLRITSLFKLVIDEGKKLTESGDKLKEDIAKN